MSRWPGSRRRQQEPGLFLYNLRDDLHLLAKRWAEDLGDVDMIYGLTQLSASWGRRHGFTTSQFTPDPEVTINHRQSITGLPPQINDKTPLTLFVFEREAFIRKFYIEDATAINLESRPRENVLSFIKITKE